MAAKKLRVATEKDAPAPPMSVSDAAQHGTRMDELVAIRAVLARALDNPNTNPTALAAISRRQMEVSREIESLREQDAQAQEAMESDAVAERSWRPEAI
jgi:hypothetical protein